MQNMSKRCRCSLEVDRHPSSMTMTRRIVLNQTYPLVTIMHLLHPCVIALLPISILPCLSGLLKRMIRVPNEMILFSRTSLSIIAREWPLNPHHQELKDPSLQSLVKKMIRIAWFLVTRPLDCRKRQIWSLSGRKLTLSMAFVN